MDLSNPIRSIVSTLEGQVYRVLARTTEPLTGSRVAEIVGSRSNAGVRAALGRLVDEGTVGVRQFGPSLLYTANREHLLWPAIESLVFNVDETRSILERRIVERVEDRLAPIRQVTAIGVPTLAFYGSVARGQSTNKSDVDIVMYLPTQTWFAEKIAEATDLIVDELQRDVSIWTGNDCSIYVLDPQRLSTLIEERDPMIESWHNDSETFYGPDLRSMLVPRD